MSIAHAQSIAYPSTLYRFATHANRSTLGSYQTGEIYDISHELLVLVDGESPVLGGHRLAGVCNFTRFLESAHMPEPSACFFIDAFFSCSRDWSCSSCCCTYEVHGTSLCRFQTEQLTHTLTLPIELSTISQGNALKEQQSQESVPIRARKNICRVALSSQC